MAQQMQAKSGGSRNFTRRHKSTGAARGAKDRKVSKDTIAKNNLENRVFGQPDNQVNFKMHQD